jgi:hypothetical protein
MAHRGWLLAGVLAVVLVVACNSDKPSPFATKSAAAGSAAPAGSASATGSGSAAVVAAVPVDAAPAEEPFKIGEQIWSLWDDGRAHHGKIKRINTDGSFRISWDETDDSDWPANLVSRTKPAPPAVTGLQVGDRVDGLWSDNRWYPGKVGAVNPDGTYAINFDDGDKAALDGHHVRRRKAAGGGGASKAAGAKQCHAGPDWTDCPGIGCHKLSTDNSNCGACFHGCRADQTCNDGVCGCHTYEHIDEQGRCST